MKLGTIADYLSVRDYRLVRVALRYILEWPSNAPELSQSDWERINDLLTAFKENQ